MKNHQVKISTVFINALPNIIIISLIFTGFFLSPYPVLNIGFKMAFEHSLATGFALCVVFILFCMIFVALPLYIIYMYYRYDKTTSLTVEDKTGEVIYNRGEKTIRFNINDIKSVVLVSSNFSTIGVSYMIWHLKNDQKIILTSLLSGNLYKYTNTIKKQVRKQNLPLLDRSPLHNHSITNK